MPTGGLTFDKLADYFKIKTVMVCGFSWIAKKKDTGSGKLDLITANGKAVLESFNN